MHYVTMGILIGIGIMLAPYVVEFCFGIIRALPLLLSGFATLIAVGAALFGIGYIIFVNATDVGFWIILSLSALSLFSLFWPRRNSDGKAIIRTRGLLSALLIMFVLGLGALIAAVLLAGLIMANWQDPAFWLGSAVFIGVAAFVVVTARRGRLEREQ